jgi:hypothetical protein
MGAFNSLSDVAETTPILVFAIGSQAALIESKMSIVVRDNGFVDEEPRTTSAGASPQRPDARSSLSDMSSDIELEKPATAR